jgi:hypothetical protein
VNSEEPIRLQKFTVQLEISAAAARRLQAELPAAWESWLELKRDLLQREADQIAALLYRGKE